MAKGLNNWCYKDICDFLKEHGFEFLEYRKGSHEAWINRTTNAVVEINVHGSKSFAIRTLETMIRQSKIDKKEWRDWTTY
ncbi:MAG: type II toxin-antitoxin system HicA family toxin [Candidatus Paceibacterota bacterium]|jgi:predicted RNA binding protein YcfA (HicA-like mRNA interferase family)